METLMRKAFITITVCLVFLAASGSAFAENDYETALELYNRGEYQEAVTLLKDYVKENPEPSAYYLIGYSLYKLGRHEEADKYFNYAFLIEPDYSPTPALIEAGKLPPPSTPIEKPPAVSPVEPSAAKPSFEPPAALEEPVTAVSPGELAIPAPVPHEAAPAEEEAAVETVAPEVAPVEEEAAVETVAPEVALLEKAPPPPPAKPQPKPTPAPVTIPGGVGIAALLMASLIPLVMGIVFYLFFSFCMFRIAGKLGVPLAWLSFIPIVQVWPFVASAGKPWWWIILLLIPIVNLFVVIYLWMLITENLGKNKLLGLLVLLPIINILYPVYLAFLIKAPAAEPSTEAAVDASQEPAIDTSLFDSLSEDAFPEAPASEGAPAFPTEPEEPSFPDEPAFPTEPEEPSFPDEPAFPTEPEEPSFPDEPAFPTEPEEPSFPDEPAFPTEPDEPSFPEEPAFPSEPDEPSFPDEPAFPSEPDEPTFPEESEDDKPLEW
jgi:hypothetical protein